jgi:two-component system sensor histidine kinase QseC
VTRLRESLRARLVGLTFIVVLISLAAVALLHQIAAGDGIAAGVAGALLGDEFPEPWQDVAVLLPFSAVVLILIWAVSVHSLRPLIRASQQASNAGPRTPEARISVPGLPSELRPLVSAMNGALDRLAEAYQTERRFTQDAAHELRTPLAALTMRLQRARLDGVTDWAAVDRDVAQMGRLVAQLLDLARKEAGGVGRRPPVPLNLARIGREAAVTVLPLVEAAGRALEVEVPETLPATGQADDLRDMIRNLLENALMHGQGRIALVMKHDGARALIEVSDEGPGVPAALREAVFDRFRKARQDTDGSGLGLAIARTVAATHGGVVGFADGVPCVVRVALPSPAAMPRQAERRIPGGLAA